MNIYGICLVRDEVDVISETLRAASRWCDAIYVFDNGSTDGTWEKVVSLAERCSIVVPFAQKALPFSNALRSQVFNQFRDRCQQGDWWCILDADEFYLEDPRIFLPKVPQRYDSVWHASFQYYFTDEDKARYDQNPNAFADSIPVADRVRHYRNNWSELRFFRHADHLSWQSTETYPRKLRSVYPVRIWVQHFQYRSPEQIQKRLDIRQRARLPFVHEVQKQWTNTVLDTSRASFDNSTDADVVADWRQRIMKAADLDFDRRDGKFVLREDLMPALPVSMRVEWKCLLGKTLRKVGKRQSAFFRNLINRGDAWKG